MKKKIAFVSSFAVAALLVVGQFTYAEKSENNMGNMMYSDGMMNMMDTMNSSEGQKIMNACGEFMKSYNE